MYAPENIQVNKGISSTCLVNLCCFTVNVRESGLVTVPMLHWCVDINLNCELVSIGYWVALVMAN